MNKEQAELINAILKKISVREELINKIRSEGAVKSEITEKLIDIQDAGSIDKIQLLTNVKLVNILTEANEKDSELLKNSTNK